MYTIEENAIHATRGDYVHFLVTAEKDGASYVFHPGDVLRIKVYAKKNCEDVVLQKDFPVLSYTESVDISLEGSETKFGDVISKPKDYWYEVELNPFTEPRTIIGYGEDGAALFRLYPEGADAEGDTEEITPEDIPIVDEELDLTSTRPVQNQAIARAIVQLNAKIGNAEAEFDTIELGENLLTDVGWNKGAGWSGDFKNGFTHAKGSAEKLTFDVDSYAAGFYVLKFDATNQYSSTTESALLVSVGGSPTFEQYRFDGDGTQYFTFYPSDGGVVFTPSANWSGVVKNIGLYRLDYSSFVPSTYSIRDTNGNEAFGFKATEAELRNVIIGKNVLPRSVSASDNVAIGHDVLTETATGYFNTAIGNNSQRYSINGTRNVSVGYSSLANITHGDRNIAVGTFALAGVTTGRNNIGIGADAAWHTTAGKNNVAISNGALNANTTGGDNTALGYFALSGNTTGINNIGVGYLASAYNQKGNYNIALGYFAHYKGTENSHNIAIGCQAMSNLLDGVTAKNNIGIGYQALYNNTGNFNVAIGSNTLNNATTDTGNNVAIGFDVMSQAVASDTEGDNIAIGHSCGRNIAGENNIVLGRGALNKACGSYNIAMSMNAAQNVTGSDVIAIGRQSLYNATTGSGNIAIGTLAGSNVSTASNVICIGSAGQNVNKGVYIGEAFAYNGSNVSIGASSPVDYARVRLFAGDEDRVPLLIDSGTLSESPHPGGIEFDGAHLYFTDASGTRKQIAVVE